MIFLWTKPAPSTEIASESLQFEQSRKNRHLEYNNHTQTGISNLIFTVEAACKKYMGQEQQGHQQLEKDSYFYDYSIFDIQFRNYNI